jgi:predicted RNA binding protein YcfA (HicA-like mRNA interferase family)
MPKLKTLSGKNVIKILEILGFRIISQRGSHIKLTMIIDCDEKISLTVPNHNEIDKGTLKSIIRQISKVVSFDLIQDMFYTK